MRLQRRALALLLPWLGLLLALAVAGLHTAQAWDATALRAAAQRLGPGAVAAVGPFEAMLADAARAGEGRARLQKVNDFFNQRIAFNTDLEVWGQDDYWASPLQTLAMARGDCEDYVIAKYASLLAAGTPLDRLRLVYVRARLPDQAAPVPHMVLAWTAQPGAEPLILDNLRTELLPASQRPDLAPVFSFNSAGLWQGLAGSAAGDPMARLSRWRDAWARTRAEGLP